MPLQNFNPLCLYDYLFFFFAFKYPWEWLQGYNFLVFLKIRFKKSSILIRNINLYFIFIF